MARAFCLIRSQPWYRREAFELGLKRAGFEVHGHRASSFAAGDVLVIWNRYGEMHDLARAAERAGARVIVAENGYLGCGGGVPKFQVHPRGPEAGHYYALALGGHNGSGTWPEGGPERFERLSVEIKPWREANHESRITNHVLVCPSRSFGRPDLIMRHTWAEETARRLRELTRREVRIRAHPGNDAPRRPLAADLAGAWVMVIWASSAGVHALAAGIPVICAAPRWILKGAAGGRLEEVENPPLPERLPHFQRLAWAQWTLSEIESGEAFRKLLSAEG